MSKKLGGRGAVKMMIARTRIRIMNSTMEKTRKKEFTLMTKITGGQI
jgi:hypothetical protein